MAINQSASEPPIHLNDESVSNADVVRVLARAVVDGGGLTTWARTNHVSKQAVWSALHDRCGVSDVLARKAGFRRVVRYIAILEDQS